MAALERCRAAGSLLHSSRLSAIRSTRMLASSYHQSSPHRKPPTTSSISVPSVFESPPPIQSKPFKHARLNQAKPFSPFLTDSYSRQHDYLRISITEKCNLRCVYCMPEEGVPQSPPSHLLTTPEILLLSGLFVSQGVSKIRLTGGEPTVRKDIVPLMQQLGELRSKGLKELCITTNGISLWRKLDAMAEGGLTGVNLSLDTLDPWQYQIMTRRKGLDAVQRSIARILEMNKRGAGIKLKINCVVMRGVNDREILDFVEMGREENIEVRFIEYMPFDGNKWAEKKMLPFQEMLDRIRERYSDVMKVKDHKNDTSKTFKIPGFVGQFGFITSMTDNFCGTCNRLRITSDGNIKVCLFDNKEISLRDILRERNGMVPIEAEAFEAMKQIEMDRNQGLTTGALGIEDNERKLLEIIGMAVKGKKEKHAGMGDLKNMKNRPMILIGGQPILGMKPFIYPFMMQPQSQTSLRRFSIRSSLEARQPSIKSTVARRNRNLGNVISPPSQSEPKPKLTHLDSSGSAHMVDISSKAPTTRKAVAKATLHFSNPFAAKLIAENGMKKGDVLGVARIAGIMASKKCSDLIPLCHPIMITKVSVECELVLPKNADQGLPSGAEVGRLRDSVVSKLIGPGHTLAIKSDRNALDNLLDNRETVGGRVTDVRRGWDGWKDRCDADPSLVVGRDGVEGVRGSALSLGVDGNIRDAVSRQSTAEDCSEDVTEVAANHRKQTVQEAQNILKGEAEVVPETGAEHHRVDAADSAAIGIGEGHKPDRVCGAYEDDGDCAAGQSSDSFPGSHLLKRVSGEVKDFGHVEITATVQCEGKTGVEMEALTATTVAALTVYDMCKAVDKYMRIDGARVVKKEGGKSGDWSSE